MISREIEILIIKLMLPRHALRGKERKNTSDLVLM